MDASEAEKRIKDLEEAVNKISMFLWLSCSTGMKRLPPHLPLNDPKEKSKEN